MNLRDAYLQIMTQDDPPPDPVAIRAQEERDELMRQACQRSIDMAARGLTVDPYHIAWCVDFVRAHPPLQRQLGTGDR